MQECISFLTALPRFEEIRLVEKLRIHLVDIDKVGDIDRMSRFDPHLFKIFVAHNNIATLLVLVAFHDLIGRHFLHVGLGHFFVFDRAQIGFAQLPKTEFLFASGRINRDRNVDQAEADAAFPSWTHNRFSFKSSPRF